jgi:hypothetical protein
MSATTFDVRTFNRHNDVATALLSAIDVRELERRETEVDEREKAVLRRERAVDRVERLHELRGLGLNAGQVAVLEASQAEPSAPAPAPVAAPVAAFAPALAPAPEPIAPVEVVQAAVQESVDTSDAKPRLPIADMLKIREREWWTKVLGIAPSMP